MKHIRRAVKYFIQILLIFILIIGVLMLIGYVPKDVSLAFKDGWSSIAFIIGIFAVMSGVYPFFGYGKRNIFAKGDPADSWPSIDDAMQMRGYAKAEEKEDGSRVYVLKSALTRAARLWEDQITITPVLGGFQAEGLVRDLARCVMAIEHKIKSYE